MATWLDSFFSLPLIGVQTVTNFDTASRLAELLAPFFKEQSQKGGISIQSPNAFTLEVDVPGSVHYTISPDNIVAKLDPKLDQTAAAGSPPEFHLKDQLSFSEMLRTLETGLGSVVKHLTAKNALAVQRIGVVASSTMSAQAAPPGVVLLREHFSQPWPGDLIKCSSMYLALISKSDELLDRCHHSLSFDTTDKANALGIILDWQRFYLNTVSVNDQRTSSALLSDATAAAVAYFERFGKGELKNG